MGNFLHRENDPHLFAEHRHLRLKQPDRHTSVLLEQKLLIRAINCRCEGRRDWRRGRLITHATNSQNSQLLRPAVIELAAVHAYSFNRSPVFSANSVQGETRGEISTVQRM